VHTALFTEVGVAGVVADEFNSPFFRNVISGLHAMTLPGARRSLTDGYSATSVDGRQGR
jgi:3-isopropylmalate/(R)-2-methylmalate dehydratase small subunit